MTYDASDAAQIKKLEKEQAQRDKDLQIVMQTPEGRRWVYGLIHDKCHMLSNSFTGDDTTIVFNEGARQVGVYVMNEVVARCGRSTYIQMLKENMDDV